MEIKVGEFVVRYLGGMPMPLRVTKITETLIICGGDETDHSGYWFDRTTGAEVDEEIGWSLGITGSFIDLNQPSIPESELKARGLLRGLL